MSSSRSLYFIAYFIAALALVAVGCDSANQIDDLSSSQGNAASEATSPPQSSLDDFVSPDDLLAAVAAEAEGFGGVYLDQEQQLVLILMHADEADAAVQALTRLYDSEIETIAAEGGIRIVEGQYDYRDLVRWYEAALSVWTVEEVTASDIDESRNRIVFEVSDLGVETTIRQLLDVLGIPTEAVLIETGEAARRYVPSPPGEARGSTQTLQSRVRPVVGGLEIIRSDGSPCTLGFNVSSSTGGDFVTASHCSELRGVDDQTVYYQNTLSDRIGRERFDFPFLSTISGCPPGKKCRRSDASLNRYDLGVTWNLGLIARTSTIDMGSITIGGSSYFGDRYEIYQKKNNVIIGKNIRLIGSQSGQVSGSISRVCRTVELQALPGQPGSGDHVLLCQNLATTARSIIGGDSGGPVFSISLVQYGRSAGGSTLYELVDLHGTINGYNIFSGELIYSPIGGIESDLGTLTVK